MKRSWTIRTQLLALVLVAITPLLLLVAFNILEHRDRAREEALRDALDFARLISARIEDHVRNIDTLLTTASILVGADLSAVDLNDARLKTLQGSVPRYFSSISVLAPDGRMLNSSTAPRAQREQLNFADRDYFRGAIAQRGLALGKPVISRTSGKWILVAARPLLAADGSVLAVVSASTLLETFQELLAQTVLPPGSMMTVLDGDGTILARSAEPLKWIGTNLSANPDIQRARKEREYSGETVAADGATRLAGYTTVAAVPWIVYVGIPGNVALERARRELTQLSVLALCMALLAGLLAYLLARQITRPVEAIAESARQVATGTMNVQVDATGATEIVNVAAQFNRMLESLERAEHKIRDNEERLRIAMRTGRIGLQVWDHATRELYISPEWKRLLGYEDREIANDPQAWQELIHPEDLPRVLTEMEAYFADLQPGHEAEFRLRHRDGDYRWVLARADPIHNTEGRPERSIACYVDITTRKQQQDSIARLNRIYAVLSGINSAIARIHDREELFHETCRIATGLGNFGLAWVGVLDAVTMEITPVAAEGPGAEEMRRSAPIASADLSQSQGALSRAVRERRPVVNNDITFEGSGRGRQRRQALRLGYRSLVVLPLYAEDAVAGIVVLFAREPNFFTEEELRLLTELAGNISFALEHMERQRKIDKLSRIRTLSSELNAAIVRIRERDPLFEEACRIVSEKGKFEMVWIGTLDHEKQQVQPVAWCGFSVETAHAVSWASISSARGTLGEAILTRKPSVRDDIDTQLPGGKLREEALLKGCRSTVCLPVVVDNQVTALIVLFAAGRAFFDRDELMLLDEVASDISYALQTIEKQEKLDYLSYYDPLTGLPNRVLFLDRTGQQMRSRGGEPLMVALILINLERFRYINDTFGRHGGDQLLKQVAQRLESAFNGKDYLARIGADGFGVVMRGIRDAAAVVHAVEHQILGCFREPYTLGDSELRVAARGGIAMFPADGADADTLFRNAEAALKRARDAGEGYLFYAADMNARAAHALSLETRLRRAVEAQEFVLHYQPKIDLASGALCGLEALLRWNDPESGLTAPGTFIPLLEETGLILEVGRWAVARALAQHREWTARRCAVPRIAVNVSAKQLQHRDFADMVINEVRQGGVPEALELEVTESQLMRDVEDSIRKLSVLRQLGIRIAMDDFGTGYSSLSYIARLPLNSLKIDRSFIVGMVASPQDMSIVTTIIALAHSLNLKVVAEGVETDAQAQTLSILKCDEAQGYHFARPLPAGEIEALLVSSRP